MPKFWEDRWALFCAFLVENSIQSRTIRSYTLAVKCILKADGYIWDENCILLSALTKACRRINDRVRTRLPIQYRLLEMIIFEVQRLFAETQPYLEILYKTIFILAYYGLFRIGELTWSNHCVKAKDIHLARNKDKLLIMLYTSKTHGKESRPQEIKITANHSATTNCGTEVRIKRIFCPFILTRQYMVQRGNYKIQMNLSLFLEIKVQSNQHMSETF